MTLHTQRWCYRSIRLKKKKNLSFLLNCAMFAWSVPTQKWSEKCWNEPFHRPACGHARRFKSQTFCKGSDCLKEDPTAGYYGMPGICWGNIALLVWACRAVSVWITLFHSLFSLTSVKRLNRMERRGGGGGLGGSRTRGECVGLLESDRLCLSTLLREEWGLVQFNMNPAQRQSIKGFGWER